MSSSTAVRIARLKEKNPEKYAAYLENQRIRGKRRRDEQKRKWAEETPTKEMVEQREREKMLKRERDRRYRERRTKKDNSKSDQKSNTNRCLMTEDERRLHDNKVRTDYNHRMSRRKKEEYRKKNCERMKMARMKKRYLIDQFSLVQGAVNLVNIKRHRKMKVIRMKKRYSKEKLSLVQGDTNHVNIERLRKMMVLNVSSQHSYSLRKSRKMSSQVPPKMKALMKKEEGESYTYCEIDTPTPGSGEVLIKVDAVAICGSDIALYKWGDVAKQIATVPFIPGHEAAGTVVKCGPNTSIAVGTKVGVENHFYCGDCYQCQHENGAICMNMGQYGHGKKTQQGGCSEYSVVPEQYLYSITRDLDPEQIAMLEPLGVSHNCIERLEVKGQDILVTGCGPVGLMAQAVAKSMGANRVIAVDVDDEKLKLAKTIGADITFNSKKNDLKQFVMDLTSGVGMDRICECSGVSPVVNSTFSLLRKGGHIGLIGLPKQPLHVENVLQDVLFKALTLKTVHGRLIFHTWKETEKLVADKHVDVKAVISHRFPMSKFEEAFEMLFSGKACKIVMDPSK